MIEAGIQLKNISKSYSDGVNNKSFAIAGLDLKIAKGGFTGIYGENGSGKSTLLRLMIGLLDPDTGEVIIDEFSSKDDDFVANLRGKIGYIFQNPENQLFCGTAEEEVMFAPLNLRLSKKDIEQRRDWALAVTGLDKLRKLPPSSLSGGQKQRLAIASVLSMQPEYMLLDEPCSMLDKQGKDELLMLLVRLNSEFGMTIVLVSHDTEDILACKRLLVMEKGEIRYDGLIDSLFVDQKKCDVLHIRRPDMYAIAEACGQKTDGFEHEKKAATLQKLEDAICSRLLSAGMKSDFHIKQ